MAEIAPAGLARRSFLYRRLERDGARFEIINNGAVAMGFHGADDEVKAAGIMGLADLSVLPRTGFKGRGSVEWLTGQGLSIGPESNQAYRQGDGAWALRLAPSEVLIVDGLSGSGAIMDRLNRAWRWAQNAPRPQQGYPMPRQDSHCWLMATGSAAPDMFAKICGVDLNPAKFPVGRIAQTSVAKMNAIVARCDLGATQAFHVLADIASSEYLFGCLEDAMGEFAGRLVGLAALRALEGHPRSFAPSAQPG
jgi:sarcosine oxidase subunit gamma